MYGGRRRRAGRAARRPLAGDPGRGSGRIPGDAATTRIVEVNEILCRTLGFEREELLDLEMPWPFTPPEGRDISYAMAPRMTAEALAQRATAIRSSCR